MKNQSSADKNKKEDEKVCGEDTVKGTIIGPVFYENDAKSKRLFDAPTVHSMPVAPLQEEGVPLTDLVRQVQDAENARQEESVGDILGYLKNVSKIEIGAEPKPSSEAVAFAGKVRDAVAGSLGKSIARVDELKQELAAAEKEAGAYKNATLALRDKLAQYAKLPAAALNYLKTLQAAQPRLGIITRELEDGNVNLHSPQGLAYIVVNLAEHAHMLSGTNAGLDAQREADLKYFGKQVDDMLRVAEEKLRKMQ